MKKKNSFIERIKEFKKPLWLQWSWFPKESEPPTQSILEVCVYFLIFLFCFDLFIDFNRIPESIISIDADKLNNSRFISRDSESDTTFYLHYQIADLEIQIPMVSATRDKTEEKGVYRGYLRDDSTRISCLKDLSGKYLLRSELNPYWHAVYDIAARNSGFPPLPNKKLNEEKYRADFFTIRDFYLRSFYNVNEVEGWKRNIADLIPDSLTELLTNYYRFKLSSTIVGSSDNNVKDTSWHKVVDDTSSPYHHIFIDQHGRNLLQSYQILAKRVLQEQKDNQLFVCSELYHANNLSTQMNRKYERLCFESKLNPIDYLIENRYVHVGVVFSDTLKTNSYYSRLSTERPGWFDRYDISQGWYHIYLNSETVDSIHFTVNFIGATDFYPMKIVPDEIGSNYIKFTDPRKILKIRKEGLSFYAQFKELENRQTIRCFGVTAILSGLLIVLITFFILGLYRGIRSIREVSNYDDMQKWLAYTRRHNANIFDVFFKDKENISDKDIVSTIKDVAEFFSLPVPAIQNRCEAIAQIMTSKEGTECELFYDWKLMEKSGINNVDTLRLSFVHELAHETLFQKRFFLFENELWVQELAADMIVGAFSIIGSDVATGKYKYVLAQLPASITHPDGKLRAAIVEFGRDFAAKLKQEQKLNDIKDVLTGLPAFVYSHYKELQEAWDMVRLEDVDKEEPIVETPIDYESLPDTNLLKQYYMKHKKEKEEEI